MNSHHRALLLGHDKDNNAYWVSHEQLKDHFHIIGATGEGKSRFAEYLCHAALGAGNGFLFIDPTPHAEAAHRLIQYCHQVGFRKVVYIDPTRDRVLKINPFHYKRRHDSVNYLDDAFRTTFSVKDAATTPHIAKYLPAVLHVLMDTGNTLAEAKFFTALDYKFEREQILRKCPRTHYRIVVEEALHNKLFLDKFISTTGRFEQGIGEHLSAMFGSKDGINFSTLVQQGYAVIVNLDCPGLKELERRLLGTIIINQLLFGIQRAYANGWRGRFYLFVDEAGQYATRNLAKILDLWRKSGLVACLMHQRYDQFEDKFILSAVDGNCKIKAMFNLTSYDDRLKMMRVFYGGKIKFDEAAFATKNIRQREGIFMLSKRNPVHLRFPEVPDYKEDVDAILDQIMDNPAYVERSKILAEINGRFSYQRKDNSRPESRTPHDSKPTGQGDIPKRSLWDET